MVNELKKSILGLLLCLWGGLAWAQTNTAKVNIASSATVTTSYVSPWESLTAVNDGFEPANSSDRPNGAYGNWNSSNTLRWVQYEWKTPATLTGTDVYWWTDGGGILIPTQAYIEYFDATTDAWVKVGDIGKVKDQYLYLIHI